MNKREQTRFDKLYEEHLRALRLQGMSTKTIDCYSRALRRVVRNTGKAPDKLSRNELKGYFADLVESLSCGVSHLPKLRCQSP